MTPADQKKETPAPGPIRRGLGFLVVNVLSPILVGVIGLTFEYWSGWFLQSPASSTQETDILIRLASVFAMMVVTTIAVCLNLLICFGIWIRPYRHVREEFSLASLLLIASMSISALLSLMTGIMPWEILTVGQHVLGYGPPIVPAIRWTDTILLLLICVVIAWKLEHVHKEWTGLKSVDQHRREQRNEHLGSIGEGWLALRKLLTRESPFVPYQESSLKDYIPQLEPVSDFQAWKDLARDLVRLSSSSYAFEEDTAWHDLRECWVGQNVNTGDLVVLYPRQRDVAKAEVAKLVEYAEQVAQKQGVNVGEVIIAVREGTVASHKSRKTTLVRHETEASLLAQLVDFKDYFSHIRRRVCVERLPDSELVLNDTFVPSRFLLPDDKDSDLTVEEYLDHWAQEPGHRQLALLGQYGQGKSTTTLMWTYHQIGKAASDSVRIPLLIELRGTSPRNLTPLALLGAWASQYSINPQALTLLLKAGRLILIFEGFDEMALVGDAEMRLKHFRTLWQFAYPKAKLLITGRPNFFIDESEMKVALGISKADGTRPYCEAIRLKLFEPDQIHEALRKYPPLVRERIHDLATLNPRFLELVSRPSLLHIVAVLWERERLDEKVDQLTSAFIMDLFVRFSYRRQGLKEEGTPGFMALTSSEREYFMHGIATYMVAKRLPNQISASQLSLAIEQLLSAAPDSITSESAAIAESRVPLRRRIEGTEYGVDHVKTDVRACGLLVDDPASPGTFRFAHKSFMEYLFAVVVARRILDTNPEGALAALTASGAEVGQILQVPEAVDFLAEQLLGYRGTVNAGGVETEEQMAHHLFRLIVGNGRLGAILKHPGAFVESAASCIVRGGTDRRKLCIEILLETSTHITFVASLTVAYYRVFEKIGIIESMNHLYSTPPLVFMILGTLMIGKLITRFDRKAQASLELWSSLCAKLGIQSQTLHRVVGTGYIPALKVIPFDYYNWRLSTDKDVAVIIRQLNNTYEMYTVMAANMTQRKGYPAQDELSNRCDEVLMTALERRLRVSQERNTLNKDFNREE